MSLRSVTTVSSLYHAVTVPFRRCITGTRWLHSNTDQYPSILVTTHLPHRLPSSPRGSFTFPCHGRSPTRRLPQPKAWKTRFSTFSCVSPQPSTGSEPFLSCLTRQLMGFPSMYLASILVNFPLFWCLTIPVPVFHQTDLFRLTRWHDTPPADPTHLFFPGPSLPANTTTGFSDVLNTNLDTSRPYLKSFSLHQAGNTHVIRTFAHISTISHPVMTKHTSIESPSSI